jgi:hypothetical protein
MVEREPPLEVDAAETQKILVFSLIAALGLGAAVVGRMAGYLGFEPWMIVVGVGFSTVAVTVVLVRASGGHG